MIENFYRPPDLVARLRQNLLGPYLDDFAGTLRDQQYAPSIIHRYLKGAERFGDWLVNCGLGVPDCHEANVELYRSQLPRDQFGDRPAHSSALPHLVSFLRAQNVVTHRAPTPDLSPSERWLARFELHLHDVAGAADSTVVHYSRTTRRFLARYGIAEPDWAAIRPAHLTEFVQREAAASSLLWRSSTATAIRAFLRFLVCCGEIRPGLEIALPLREQVKHSTLPRHLTPEQVKAALSVCRDGTLMGIRDLAVLLLLARLGVRAGEVAELCLDDVDWREGRLLIRAQKTRRERVLPLTRDVGSALTDYLAHARRRTATRSIFLQCAAPYAPLKGSPAVYHIAHKRLVQSGYPVGPRVGAHLFRHTVATRMVRSGASFKDVADVLGHRSLVNTGIYAKLDLESLAKVALPWPVSATTRIYFMPDLESLANVALPWPGGAR